MNERRTISVSQTASERVPADYGKIAVTASRSDGNYKAATDGADVLCDSAVAELKKACGAAVQIRSQGMSVSEVRDKNDYSVVTGYRAQRMLTVEFDLDKTLLGKALNALGVSGCEWRLSYSLKTNAASDRLVVKAVEEAKRHAQTIAQAAGVTLGALVSAEYGAGGGRPVMLARAAVHEPDPENITVSETVVCTFAIE